jgi:hypothetical protein
LYAPPPKLRFLVSPPGLPLELLPMGEISASVLPFFDLPPKKLPLRTGCSVKLALGDASLSLPLENSRDPNPDGRLVLPLPLVLAAISASSESLSRSRSPIA